MAVNEQAACFGRVAAKSQNGFDVASLRQQNVWVRLDRIMKAESCAKVRVVCLECCRAPATRGQGSTEYG